MKSAAFAAELVLVALTSVAGALLAAQLPLLGLPLAASALAWVSYRFGYVAGAFAAVFATAGVTLLYGTVSAAVLVGPALVLAGPVTAWALTRWPAMRVGYVLGGLLFVAATGWLLYEALLAKSTIPGMVTNLVKPYVDEIVKSSLTQEPGRATEIREVWSTYLRYVVRLWPSATFAMFGFAAAAVIPVVSRAGTVLGRSVNRAPKLPDVDLTPHLVWPVIAGLGLLAYTTWARMTDGLLWDVGANLLLIARPVLFLQGLAAFAALYRKAKLGRIGRGLGYALLTVSELVVPSISVLGLVDLFVNLRKLPRTGAPVAPAEA